VYFLLTWKTILFKWDKLINYYSSFSPRILIVLHYNNLSLFLKNCCPSAPHNTRLSLPESGSLPSAMWFAECFFSGTRQRSYLPSAK
jgi:hypothetical protein